MNFLKWFEQLWLLISFKLFSNSTSQDRIGLNFFQSWTEHFSVFDWIFFSLGLNFFPSFLCTNSSCLEYFEHWLQKLAYRVFHTFNFHHWTNLCYQKGKLLSNMKFWNPLIFTKSKTKKVFTIPHLINGSILIANLCSVMTIEWERYLMRQFLQSALKTLQMN